MCINTITMTNGIQVVLVGLAVFVSFSSGDPLHCLSCQGTVAPRHCHTVEKCGEGQECFTEKYTTVNGLVLFNTGCRDPSFCNSTSPAGNPLDLTLRKFHPHITECKECCNSSVCNSDGCGSKGYPANRGPLCFTCPQTTDPALCETIDICNEDEICHVHREREFGDIFFSQSCQDKRGCHRQMATQVFGKRSEQECTNCCNEDLCNIVPTNIQRCQDINLGGHPMDCWEIYQRGIRTSGVHKIYPWNDHRSKHVVCNMDLYPGGWTIIQTRLRQNHIEFNRTWTEYKNGFGGVDTDYWLGNEAIHQLTKAHRNMLYIRIEDINGRHYEEQYSEFKIVGEDNRYRLTISPGNGTAGDKFESYSNGSLFYTYDNDNKYECGRRNGGGWWYSSCANVDLNVPLFVTHHDAVWYTRIAQGKLLHSSAMLLTRK